MTWVKICGITNLEDALVAVEAGADAVGFVFYEKSPRCVSVETVREIVGKLPEKVEKIGVFVDLGAYLESTLLSAGLTGTQCYLGSQSHFSQGLSPLAIRLFFPRKVMAIPMSLFTDPFNEIGGLVEGYARAKHNRPEGSTIPDGINDTFLLDSGNSHAPGGTGKSFDWVSAEPIAEVFRRNGLELVVAGGLTPENVGKAIRMLKPWGVDVSSGVEARPGKKDPDKVRAFVRAVREADRRAG